MIKKTYTDPGRPSRTNRRSSAMDGRAHGDTLACKDRGERKLHRSSRHATVRRWRAEKDVPILRVAVIVASLLSLSPVVMAARPGLPKSALKLSDPVQVTGRLDGIRDGTVVLSRPIPENIRMALSQGRQVPLRAVPRRTERTFLLRPPVSPEVIRPFLGEEVEVDAVRDTRGFFYIVDIRPESERRR